MNPSTQGWIDKLQLQSKLFFEEVKSWNEQDLYYTLLESGFIYGTNVNCINPHLKSELSYTQEELAKLNLMYALIQVYQSKENDGAEIKKIIAFYNQVTSNSKSSFGISFSAKNESNELEKIIHHRIQPKGGLLQKNFSKLLTNAMLFIDVLCFQLWLEHPEKLNKFAIQLEGILINLVYLAIQEKTELGKYEELIMKLLKSSLRYEKQTQNEMLAFDEMNFDIIDHYSIKKYAVDLICMAMYSDELIEVSESEFVFQLATKIDLPHVEVKKSISALQEFVQNHKSKIAYFNYKNPLQTFYNRTQRNTQVLLRRNKKRLIQEIMESKELFLLLKASTVRDLNNNEKQKVKEQLFDIFKSIPSLAIFALPGGGILLPIIIRFIPKLLPSSFNENNKS
ncbi:LETM1-related biofilm-associated protein [Psychroflexus planctonicus]|uniref:Letm1 RBD domain-containing protein n=1 Tax=Psychroflexus planctonicus TaxID=1526575 RepID=A0ABQ1SF27_9FLAO|nr:LETM1-related biofilm-associated protein [Psychroflexus planctonicus]GGE35480.1 hypothetical protein GCM10010832_14570 [Psychroflexus planctonicus]